MEGVFFGEIMNAMAETEPLSGPGLVNTERSTTPAEAVAQLQRIAAANHTTTAYVVVLMGDSPIGRKLEDGLLEILANLMRDGGRLIGYYWGWEVEPGHITFSCLPLPEYAEDERIEQHLIALLHLTGEVTREGGGSADPVQVEPSKPPP